jgi:hypothetical protein
LAGGWFCFVVLGVGGLGVVALGVEGLGVLVEGANSHHLDLSRAMAFHVAKSVGRSLRFSAFLSLQPEFISRYQVGRECATQLVG